MDLHERLKEAVIRARAENDLPDMLAEPLLEIAESPASYGEEALPLLRKLVEILPDYDTYAQTGYLGMGVNDADVGMLLRAIERIRGERDSDG